MTVKLTHHDGQIIYVIYKNILWCKQVDLVCLQEMQLVVDLVCKRVINILQESHQYHTNLHSL
jgi:hypothetical protein